MSRRPTLPTISRWSGILPAACALLLAGAACGFPGLGKSADEYYRASLDTYSRAHSLEIVATFTLEGKHLQMDVQVLRPSSAKGSMTVDGVPVEFVSADGRTYLRGKRFAIAVKPQVGRAVGDRWFLAPTGELQKDLDQLLSPDPLQKGWSGLKKGGTQRVNGYDAVKLTASAGELDVSAAAPYYLVRVTTASGHKLEGGLTDLTMDLTRYDDRSITVEAPAEFIDLNDPKTLPARFQVVDTNIDHNDCGPDGCRIVAVMQNLDGPGTATATGTLFRSDGTTVLATCTVSVPQTAYLATTTVACKPSSAAWKDYWENSHEKFYYRMSVRNSGWDDTATA